MLQRTTALQHFIFWRPDMKSIIERSRYLAVVGIISLLIASFSAFAWGAIKTVSTTLLVIQTLGRDAGITIELIEILDSFLIATAIFIFAASLYELFIGKLDLPEWMLAHNLYELKGKLSSMIVLVMAVKFLQRLIGAEDAADLLQRGIATAVVAAALIAFTHFGKKD
ncbi:MAG: YqhA family protein [Chloroflexi bacterium]|nr:YqhA family protein [Chloroflexota bacterium]